MKTFLKFLKIFLLMSGVFSAETDEGKTVMEGDSVTLNPDLTQIQGFIQMLWRFGDPGPVIAQIDGNEISYTSDERFRGRLQLNQTGSLIIKNMRTKHSGLYKLEIDRRTGTSYKTFIVTVYESPSVIAGAEAEMKSVSVMEGDPVTLHVPQLQGNELIMWRFGDEEKLITKADIEAKSSPLYYEERFRDRLMVENQTGSLIITNTRTTDSGLYAVKISSNKQISYKRFIVTVSAVPDSVPGVSPAAVAGIVVAVLLVSAAAAAGVMYFCRPRTTNLSSQTWSVPAGDNVTLNPETEIQTGDEIQWLFGAEDTLIAQIRRETREMTVYRGPDMIFRDKLKLDETTGSLTIKLIDTEHSGLYTLKIRRGRETLYKRFTVSIEERTIGVMKGDPVTLNPETKIQTDDEIQWLFEDKEQQTVLAEIKTTEVTKHEGPDGRFSGKLKLNMETGSLTITNSTAAHSGVYTLKIRRRKETLYKRFNIYVEEKKIAVMEGEPVTLNPATEINKDDLIRWLFRDEQRQTLIAEIKRETREIFKHDDVSGGRFRDRLELDTKTGSLTVKNTRTSHSGRYHLEITSSSRISENTFIVTVKDKVEKKSLTEGDSVTLNPDTEIQRDDQILWMFEDQDKLIAQIKGGTVETYDDANKRFKDRLELNKTGSLTIKNTEAKHTGLYKLQTISSSRGILFKKFKVLIHLKDVSVTEGESVHLYTGLTGKQTDDEIQWMFGDENALIAEIKGETGEIFTHDYVADRRFRDGLELDATTGSLTIKDTRTSHSGVYKLQITSSSRISEKTFIVTVKDKVEKKSLIEGGSVTLNPDTEIQRDDQILWMFGVQDYPIAQIKGGTPEIYDDVNKRFKGRLKLDETTGSLTITNIRSEHTGLYKLQTISSSRRILYKKFKVLIRLKDVSVTEGEPVALYTGLTGKQTDDEIQWRFGDENSLIAEIKGETVEKYDGPDERFRDRLELNKTTGDLTIKNSTAEHAGHYKLKIYSSEGTTYWTFIVTITAMKKSLMEKNDSRGKRVNESATVVMPLLNGDDLDEVNEGEYVNVMNEEEGTSSL